MHTVFWWENLIERDHLKDPGLDRRIILKWVFKKWDGMAWTGLIWLKYQSALRNIPKKSAHLSHITSED